MATHLPKRQNSDRSGDTETSWVGVAVLLAGLVFVVLAASAALSSEPWPETFKGFWS
jgi:hypothetical protein